MKRRGQPQRLLFIRTDRLGETLLNLPAAAALKAAFPGSRLTFVAHPDVRPLIASLPWVDHTIAAPQGPRHAWWRRAWRLGRQLRAGRFDVAVVSNPKQELHVAVWLAGIAQRLGYDRKWGCLLTHRVPDHKARGTQHEVESNLELVCRLGVPIAVPSWHVPALPRERAEVFAMLVARGMSASQALIVVHPWTSHPVKRWPMERFCAFIERVRQRLPAAVVIVGNPQAPAVMPAGGSVVDLTNQLSLTQLAALLQQAKLLISSDSGPVHLAAAVGTPTVALFGTTEPARSPARWGPWGEGHTVIWKPSMDEITVEEVLDAVERHLG